MANTKSNFLLLCRGSHKRRMRVVKEMLPQMKFVTLTKTFTHVDPDHSRQKAALLESRIKGKEE